MQAYYFHASEVPYYCSSEFDMHADIMTERDTGGVVVDPAHN